LPEVISITTSRPDYTEHGDSGTRRSGGRITGYERNTRIQPWAKWADVGDEMLGTDPKLAEANSALSSAVLSADWLWEPGPAADGPSTLLADRAKRHADALNAQWGFDGGQAWFDSPWEQMLTAMVRYVPIGARYLEELYGARDGKVYLRQYADREPTAHLRWLWDENGKWSGVEQSQLSGIFHQSHRILDIPSTKLLHLAHNGTGQNLEGRGALRPCYQWFQMKQHMMDLLAIAAERWAVPTPHVVTDRNKAIESGYTPKQVDQAVAEAKSVAERYLSGEQAWLSSIVGIDFKTFGEGSFDPTGLLSSLNHANQEMLSAWLMAFLEMGLGDVGSRALGQVLQEQSVLAVVNVLDTIAGAVNGMPRPGGGTAARLVWWNDPAAQGDLSLVPRLTHRGIKVDGLAELLPHLPNLINTGAVSPSDTLEAAILMLGGVDSVPDRSLEDRLGARDLTPEKVASLDPSGRPENPVVHSPDSVEDQ
jgi:hypothetical protein